MSTQEQASTQGQVLDGYLTTAELGKQIKRTERTLARWHVMRIGPPRVYVGTTPYYALESVRLWLASRKQPLGSGKAAVRGRRAQASTRGR